MSKQNSAIEDDDDSSTSDILDPRNDEGWQDVEEDVIDETFVSLFDSKTFQSVVAMFEYCKSEHGFDIWKIQKENNLDFLGLVKLVNYTRSEVKKGNPRPDTTRKSNFEDEMLLIPVMEDDAVLYSLEEILQGVPESASKEVEELRDQLASLQSQFTAYRNDIQRISKIDGIDDDAETVKISSSKLDAERAQIDKNYFSGYSYNTIHESMLKDRVRTDAYRDFIYDNKDVFQDKIVLDVGCGTGILSMFCAKAGAKLVIAVDNSDIVEKAKQNVRANDLDEKITCIKGKIEEVSLPVPKVDIIVSEWMGYCLLFESMLDSVIFARDKFLAPNGLMVPSHVDIKAAPLADSELQASYIDFWKDVYGFDMTAMLDRAHEEALVRFVDSKELCADSSTLLRLDLHVITVKELDFETSCTFAIKKDEYQKLEGFVLWFDTFFLPSRSSATVKSVEDAKAKGLVAFSTGPAPEEPTHWQQTICLIKNSELSLSNNNNNNNNKTSNTEPLKAHFTFKKRFDSHRSLDIGINWSLGNQKSSQDWFLE